MYGSGTCANHQASISVRPQPSTVDSNQSPGAHDISRSFHVAVVKRNIEGTVLQSRSLLPSTTVSSTATTTYFTSTAAFITHSMTFSSTTPGDIAASTAASTAPSTDAAAAAAATTIFAYSVFTNQTNAIQPAKVRPALPSVCSPLPIF